MNTKKIKKFEEINKAAKVRRLNKIKRIMDVPNDYHQLYSFYNKNNKNDELLFIMRKVLLEQKEIPDEVKCNLSCKNFYNRSFDNYIKTLKNTIVRILYESPNYKYTF